MEATLLILTNYFAFEKPKLEQYNKQMLWEQNKMLIPCLDVHIKTK